MSLAYFQRCTNDEGRKEIKKRTRHDGVMWNETREEADKQKLDTSKRVGSRFRVVVCRRILLPLVFSSFVGRFGDMADRERKRWTTIEGGTSKEIRTGKEGKTEWKKKSLPGRIHLKLAATRHVKKKLITHIIITVKLYYTNLLR